MVIECLDFGELIRRCDDEGTLFYLDPPYWGCEDDYGKAVFVSDDFQRLADQLAGIKGRFILSINDVPEVREIVARFDLEEVKVSYTVGTQTDRAPMRSELPVTGGGDG